MGILISVGPYRRLKAITDAEWYESPESRALHERLFLETYFAPPEPSIALLKCVHGVYLGDQHSGYCTVCTDYRVSGPCGIGHSDKRLRGQTVLSKRFHRRGFVKVPCQVLPPLDQHLKMRTSEAVGGYVRKGVAVRAENGYGPKINEKTGAESFTRITTNRLPISQATMPNPIRGFRAWTYPEDERFFKYVAAYRNQYPTVPPPAYDFPGCTIIYFGRQDSGGLCLLSERLPDARKLGRAKGDKNQRGECCELSAIDWKDWRPPDYEPTEKELTSWRHKYWSKRTPYDPAAGHRAPLNLEEETRIDRQTRAHLKMQWGGRWRPKEMHKCVWKRLQSARVRVVASGVGPYCWPSHPNPSLRGTTFGGEIPHDCPHWKRKT